MERLLHNRIPEANEAFSAHQRGVSLRVLVADNDPDTNESYCLLVRLWGYDAQGVCNGSEALKRAFAYQPDVLFLDIGMPGMSGYDVARRLREVVRFEDTLLIAITGYADDGHRFLGATAGFDHYLVKPVEPSILESLLRIESDRLEGLLKRDPTPHPRIERQVPPRSRGGVLEVEGVSP